MPTNRSKSVSARLSKSTFTEAPFAPKFTPVGVVLVKPSFPAASTYPPRFMITSPVTETLVVSLSSARGSLASISDNQSIRTASATGFPPSLPVAVLKCITRLCTFRVMSFSPTTLRPSASATMPPQRRVSVRGSVGVGSFTLATARWRSASFTKKPVAFEVSTPKAPVVVLSKAPPAPTNKSTPIRSICNSSTSTDLPLIAPRSALPTALLETLKPPAAST